MLSLSNYSLYAATMKTDVMSVFHAVLLNLWFHWLSVFIRTLCVGYPLWYKTLCSIAFHSGCH
jgi:hypothetical protein